MGKTSFRAIVLKEGVNPFVDEPVWVTWAFAAFADYGRIRVAGTIDGCPRHATLVPVHEGTHRLYVNGGMRAAAGIQVGDRVTLALRPLRPDEVDVSADLTRHLAKARLRSRFDALSVSHRRELVRSIEDAPSPNNRATRIKRTLAHLR